MKTSIIRSLSFAAVVLAFFGGTANAQRYFVDYGYGAPISVEVVHPGYRVTPVYPPAPGGQRYQPHLAADYRAGYWAGRRDACHGFARNYRPAYLSSGAQWESYADGFEGRPMNH